MAISLTRCRLAAEKSCGGGTSLWEASVGRALAYRAGGVLNQGFATGPVTMEAIESGEDDTLRATLHRHIGRTKKSYAENIDDIAQADRVFDANRPRSKQLVAIR